MYVDHEFVENLKCKQETQKYLPAANVFSSILIKSHIFQTISSKTWRFGPAGLLDCCQQKLICHQSITQQVENWDWKCCGSREGQLDEEGLRVVGGAVRLLATSGPGDGANCKERQAGREKCWGDYTEEVGCVMSPGEAPGHTSQSAYSSLTCSTSHRPHMSCLLGLSQN